MSYFIRGPWDAPHLPDHAPDRSVCGESLRTAVEISDLQVLVYYGGKACNGCDPQARKRSESGRLGRQRQLEARRNQ